MKGKILDVSSNDLYGNVDLRKAEVFACFNHKKYNNKYIIFTFYGELDKKKLYYGSTFLKSDSLVVFSINKENFKYINTFIEEYLNGKVNDKEYEIIDISNLSKIELVSYDNMESNDLVKLEDLSIKKVVNNLENSNKKKKPTFLYVLLIVLIILLIGLTYFYFNPNAFMKEYTIMTCKKEQYNASLKMNYLEQKEITFDDKSKLKKILVYDIYTFENEEEYMNFKSENKENVYFKIDGTFKYNDETLELKIIYKDASIMDNYEEVKNYLKEKEFTCNEEVYYE